ncbi:MAG: hypothetical protein RMJ52_17410 [Gemmataceae bacterium]|nr:hypothetical protein [Gemmataceae bacterium]
MLPTVEATIPAMYAGLVFQNYHIAHQGSGLWEVTVRYGKREPKQPGESSFSFDTGGGTTHITRTKPPDSRQVSRRRS